MTIDKYIYTGIILIMLSGIVSALDNPYPGSPTCINPSYDTGYSLLVTENHATLGNTTMTGITSGYATPSSVRVNNGINLLCAVSDPTVDAEIGGQYRLWGTSEDGSVWYTDVAQDNYTLGFFSILYWNPTYRIATLSSATVNRKIAIDSSGNVYVADGLQLYKYVKELDYTGQLLYTYTRNTDYSSVDPVYCGNCQYQVIDLQIDASDNVHTLIGSWFNNPSGASSGFLSHSVITQNGAFVTAAKGIESETTGGSGTSGYLMGGLVLDTTDYLYNYTYAYYSAQGTKELVHNSTSGSTVISTLTGLASVTDLAYYNSQIFIASAANNIVRSYVTTYTGYTQAGGGATSPSALTYSVAAVESMYATYGNNSEFQLSYYIQATDIPLVFDTTKYKWRIDVLDENDTLMADHFTGTCEQAILDDTCTIAGTLKVDPPSNGWASGNYTAKMYEYDTQEYTLAYLYESEQWYVMNSSIEIVPPITEDINSGASGETLSQIDGWVSLLGMGTSAISKFLFAMIIIIGLTFFGFVATKGNSFGGVVSGSLPFCFFVFVEYIPLWTIIVVVMVVALKTGWFR